MADRLMKAIRVHEFGGPEVMQYEDVPLPEPSADQIRVRVNAAGVNPVDTYIRTGTHARKPDLPYTPGSDAAGVVDAVGADVTDFAVGDRVYTSGTLSGSYADYALCRADSVFPLPSSVDFAQGAALGTPYATAWRALFQRGEAKAGQTLLVHGATGGVGLAVVQLAVAAGLRVFATGGTKEGREYILEQGATQVFDHHGENYTDDIQSASRGLDLIVEMLANVNLDRDLQMLARHGCVVVVGNRGRVAINPRAMMSKESSIRGMTLFAATPAETHNIHAGLYAGLANGSLAPYVAREMQLEEAISAHKAVIDPAEHGKIVLI